MNDTALDFRRRCASGMKLWQLRYGTMVIALLSTLLCSAFRVEAQSETGKFPESEQAAKSESPALTDAEIRQCVQDLSSEQFSIRQQATATLRRCPANQLETFGQLIANEGSSEARRRWIEVLEHHYKTLEPTADTLEYVSESLEKEAKSDIWHLSEAADQVLSRHWEQRVRLAVVRLNSLGVPTDPSDPRKLFSNDGIDTFDALNPTSEQHLKLVVDHSFPDKPEVYEVMRRLAPLRSPMFLRFPQRVSVMLINTHTLAKEQEAEILGIFGDIAVQRRGPACLGITPDGQRFESTGVAVGGVAKGKSADLAGIRRDDLIIGFNDEPLGSFDEMVKRLRDFDIGDTITLQVISRRSFEPAEVRDVEVKLTGWYDGAISPPKEKQ